MLGHEEEVLATKFLLQAQRSRKRIQLTEGPHSREKQQRDFVLEGSLQGYWNGGWALHCSLHVTLLT